MPRRLTGDSASQRQRHRGIVSAPLLPRPIYATNGGVREHLALGSIAIDA